MNTAIIPTIEPSDDGTLRVSSETIAKGAGVTHQAVLKLIDQHSARFGQVGFEIRPGYNNAQVRVALLDEKQATSLMMLMKNTEKVLDFKFALTDAFFTMAQQLAQAPVIPTGPELLALAVVEAHKVIEAKDHHIATLEPKADAWHDLVSSSGSLSFRDAAKVISNEGGVTIGGNRLIQVLTEWRWVFRPPSTPEEKAKGKVRSIRAYQTQIDAETLTEKAKTYTDQETGEKKLSNNPQTRVTGKGLDAIRTRLINTLESA